MLLSGGGTQFPKLLRPRYWRGKADSIHANKCTYLLQSILGANLGIGVAASDGPLLGIAGLKWHVIAIPWFGAHA
jgi:hypothetical protein